jgi:hypothetical protein
MTLLSPLIPHMVLRTRGGWQTYCINFLENSLFLAVVVRDLSQFQPSALHLVVLCVCTIITQNVFGAGGS